jgi:uncharacterized protein
MTQTETEILTAPHVLEYPYKRSLGPVIGRFFTSLKERRIEGVRTAAGRVIVPPAEYDPETSEPLSEFVEVGETGVVTSWAWVTQPRPNHPLQRPFAFALVRLDGADTAMLHVVDAGDESGMSVGMRVRARWAAEPQGGIRDIECFEPVVSRAEEPSASGGGEPLAVLRSPLRLEYTHTAGETSTRFLRGFLEGKILGSRCPVCDKVYVPMRRSCPICVSTMTGEVELAHTGTITKFCIVNLPFAARNIEIPYVSASILLDGAGVAIFHLIQEIPYDEIRIGMRVEAVWEKPENRVPGMESIMHFRPTGEPDVEIDLFEDADA